MNKGNYKSMAYEDMSPEDRYQYEKQQAYDEEERRNRMEQAGGVGSGKLRRKPSNITPKKKKRKK